MVKTYRDFLNDSNSNNRFRPNTDDSKKEDNSRYLDVWKVNPSYKDVNTRETVLKATSLVVIGLLFFSSVLYTTYNLVLSIGIAVIVSISFVMAFHNNFFSLRHLFDFRSFKPLGEIVFWQTKYDKFVLFFTNYKELNTTGVRTFRIKVLPENVHANLNRFYKGLHALKVPFSYQIIQRPLQTSNNCNNSESSTFETIIFFSTFYNIQGKITESKLVKMIETLREYAVSLKSAFASNFHHFKVVQLSGEELVNAYRILVLKQDVKIEEDSKRINCKTVEPKIKPIILKASYILAIVICLDRLLLVFNLPIIAQFLATLTILIAIIVIWWREVFFFLIKNKLFKSNDIQVVDPFSDIKFFKVSEAPETIFYQVEGKIIGGIKINNAYFTHPPPYCSASKFYEALIHEKMPFTTTIQLTPLNFHQFDKEGFKFLKDIEQQKLLTRTESFIDGNKWLSSRSGIWSVIITYSTSAILKAPTLDYEIIDEIEQKLKNQSLVLRKSFKQFFVTYELKQLRKNELESGLLFETLKNKFFRRNGTHLNYLMFQGKTLMFITEISDQFKKGIETRLAAEFNTPLQLTNFITIGHTINTEFLENEVPMGFSLEQLRSLFITNGTNSSREALCQKIVAELVKAGYPSVIFDFTGNWSKLMSVFEGTIYEDKFLYLKVGKTFLVNPLFSELPYDKDNIGYLDYMFDAFALCFKKDERTIDAFKNTIARNPNIDVSTLTLDLTTMREWEKSPITDSLLSFFSEFTSQDISFMQRQQLDKQEIIPSYELIMHDKTVIIDFSEVKNYDKQCYFTFVILSKFIHYLKTEKAYYPKFLIVPHLDVIFDGFFIDKKVNYGIIDKFLEPFQQKGFGTICSASQIRYIHPNAFNYFENLVTFKATDKRDSATLGSLMNLESLHGIGYYSRSRNEGYQLKYIASMKKDEAVVKREDIYQPFPVEFDLKEVRDVKPLSWEEIVANMGKQGYDLENAEKRIIQRAEKTLFQKDFGNYSVLIEGIIKFLNNLKKLDQVGNLYEQKVKKELTEWLHPYILKITKDKKREKEIKNKTFEILVRHRYLVESHPRRASGSESLQTSFVVGPHYDEVLHDYYETQRNAVISYEPLDVESENSDKSESSSQVQKINAKNLKNAFTKHFAPILYYEHFKMHQSIKSEEFEKALKIGKNLLKKFLHAIYNSYYSVNYAIMRADINKFIKSISDVEGFPFSANELTDFHTKCGNISFEEEGIERRSKETFEMYSKIFDGFKRYIEGDMGAI
ncbi:MAG: hypothetical protein CEE42_04415 [Promethearchaeota archaeon Loki_b31]|nr:MAG: hypothetical protein CEE42_04415 [Candidatus Lokiarchaeota archaeon Loki_b31]